MSSPSGFDTAVRGVVMLGVLGGAAWGAMQYPPVCKRATQIWHDWEQGTLFRSQNDGMQQARLEGGDAPPFGSEPSSAQAGHGAASGMSPAGSGLGADATANPPRQLAADDTSQPISAPLQSPADPRRARVDEPRRPLTDEQRAADLAADRRYDAQQVDFRRAASTSGAPGASASDSMTELDARLSRLGASYCLLERWEQNPPRYRFHCRVALTPGAEPRRFEASGSDPVLVMRQVADAVDASRGKR